MAAAGLMSPAVHVPDAGGVIGASALTPSEQVQLRCELGSTSPEAFLAAFGRQLLSALNAALGSNTLAIALLSSNDARIYACRWVDKTATSTSETTHALYGDMFSYCSNPVGKLLDRGLLGTETALRTQVYFCSLAEVRESQGWFPV